MNKYFKVIIVNACIVAVAVLVVKSITFFANEEKTIKSEAVSIAAQAPNFTGIDSQGKTHRLSDYKEKIVVLEWKNHKCPFVKKFYDQGDMQTFQQRFTDQDIVWLSIVSSAEGKQGYQTPQECNNQIKTEGSQATAVILDPTGEIGKLYEAKTTPHMYVINPKGKLVYAGAIDSIRSADPSDISKATNYVVEAIKSIQTNTPVAISSTQSYGCSIKY
ncbi:redoxin domain-containing protein [bacterium]|nr:redoxin domain-containing protein [bacterium]